MTLDILREALLELRWNDQDGYPSYLGNGKWSFVKTSIWVTPDQLNALFKLANLRPDSIIPNGTCKDCIYSRNGQERGYEHPCMTCKRPKMTNFESRSAD